MLKLDSPMARTIQDRIAAKFPRLYHYGHVKHLDSLTESEFVALLDQFAFFWPGTENSPSEMGRNFAARYQRRGDSLVQIVAATRSLMRLNRAGRIFISQCNSGAPRS